MIAEDYALERRSGSSRGIARWIADAQDEAERARIERIAATPGDAMRAVLDALDRSTAASSGTCSTAASRQSARGGPVALR